MALVSSLFTAISGLRNHQTMLDVISNNVSNVNTIGFKAGRVMFRDLLSQTMSGAAGADPLSNQGGVNAIQMGTGVSVAAIDTMQTQGTLQATGNPTDMAISGDGFFVVQAGTQQLYTRDGSFRIDAAGSLVSSSGGVVQGWAASAPVNSVTGQTDPMCCPVVDSSDPAQIGAITIDSGTVMKAQETNSIGFSGNLDAGATAINLANSAGLGGTTQITVVDSALGSSTYTVGYHERTFTVYDSLGYEHTLISRFTNVSGTQVPEYAPGQTYENNTWKWEVSVDPSDTTVQLVPDNVRYLDPVSGEEVRAAHSGLMHFTTTGAIDWVSYGDANTTAVLDGWAAPAAAGLFTDENQDAIIGFEGAGTVAPYDLTNADQYGGDALNVWYDPSNPALNAVYQNGVFDNPLDANGQLAAGTLSGVTLEKLPIVLAYETYVMNNSTMTTPPLVSGTTPGRLGTFMDAVSGYSGYTDFSVPLAPTGPQVPMYGYVQAVDIDWGSVSSVTRLDLDVVDQDVGGGPTSELPGSFGDGERDNSLGGGAPVAYESDMSGKRDGLTQDVSGQWQNIGGVNTYVPFSNAMMDAQDGFAKGRLMSISVSQDGTIIGAFDNNQTQGLARVAVASFQNPTGLAKIGDTHFTVTANSGVANIGEAGQDGRGSVIGGVLEQSNVDLSQELTNMIVAQRGFEANARLITTSDRILDTLVNMGR